MATKEITFKVFRYKQGDPAPHYDHFSVACDENTTVLIALQDIRRDQDTTLILRHSCHHASCGTCGMRINGKEELSCVVKVLDLGTPTVTVEPLENLPLVADLVVDMSGFYQRYAAAEMPYIRQSEFNPGAAAPEGIDRFIRYENCLECGLCLSACPVVGSDAEYLGPAALAAAWRVVEEPRGRDGRRTLDWVDNEHGCWRCHVAFECSEVCPSNVDPAVGIANLRRKLWPSSLLRLIGIKR